MLSSSILKAKCKQSPPLCIKMHNLNNSKLFTYASNSAQIFCNIRKFILPLQSNICEIYSSLRLYNQVI